MSESSDTRWPTIPVDVRLGSCPDCGTPMWLRDLIGRESPSLKAIYRCVGCKHLWSKDEIIPF